MNNMIKISTLLLFLAISVSSISQIQYVDIVPDKILNNTIDTIDINSDGIDDLIFTQESNIPNQDAHGVGVTLLHTNVEFVGNPPPYDPSHFYTYKLDSNILVDANADNKSWVVKLGPNDAVRIMYMFFYNVPYHLGEWINGVTNGYLGIRIKINNKWHYGWIRMDVPIGAQQLTIKDFAYNLEAEQGIYTGQQNNYTHNLILVNYDKSNCENILIYERDSFSHLAYDKIYSLNNNGQYDSIGYVNASSPPYFTHSDSSLVSRQQSYKITAVDSANIEWIKSDSINSLYASINKDVNNNFILNWTAFTNANFSQYIIYRTDTFCEKLVAIDTVPSNIISYNISSSLLDSSCNEFQVGIALSNVVNVPGIGLIDTIKSNIATENFFFQLNPIAGFRSELINNGFINKVQFYDTSRADIQQWYWYFGDGSSSNLRNPQHEFLPGKYTVSLKISNCFGEDSTSIIDYIDIIDGVNNLSVNQKLRLYPNPTTNSVEIIGVYGVVNLKIFSSRGILLMNKRIDANQNIELNNYPKGIYHIIIEQDKLFYSRSIIKQ